MQSYSKLLLISVILISLSYSIKAQTYTFESKYVYESNPYPWGICVDHEGNIYVSLTGKQQVKKFDNNWNEIFSIGTDGVYGDSDYLLNDPSRIKVDTEGLLYVCDAGNSKIKIYNPQGEHVKTLSTPELVEWILDIELLSNGEMYVTQETSFFHLDNEGNEIAKYGPVLGTGDESVTLTNWITGLESDEEGNIFILDDEGTIFKFEPISNSITTIFQPEHYRICNDLILHNDRFYIADDDNHVIHIVKTDGVELPDFGQYGTEDGDLYGFAYAMAFDLEGDLYIAQSRGSAVKFVSEQEIDLYAEEVSLTSGDAFELETTTIGQLSATHSIEIHNSKTGVLSIDGEEGQKIRVEGAHASDFIVDQAEIGNEILGESSLFFTVQFAPSSSGERNATLHIYSDDPNERDFSLELVGVGIKLKQEITFNPIANINLDEKSFELEASSDSELPITFSSSNTDVASIEGNQVILNGVGETVITAHQSGDHKYKAASDVNQKLTVFQIMNVDAEITDENNLYPNPSTDGFFQLNTSEPITYSVFDLNGQLKIRRKKAVSILDLSELDAGIYLIQFEEGNEISSQKIIRL